MTNDITKVPSTITTKDRLEMQAPGLYNAIAAIEQAKKEGCETDFAERNPDLIDFIAEVINYLDANYQPWHERNYRGCTIRVYITATNRAPFSWIPGYARIHLTYPDGSYRTKNFAHPTPGEEWAKNQIDTFWTL